MEPTLREGDRVIVGPLGRDRLRTGDLFLYRGENRLVVHRFLGSRTFAGGQRLLCQRGDNLEGWGWVSQKAVLGRVLSIEHGERTFQMEAFPWTWLNPLIGGWGRLWVGIAELSRFGGKLLPHRPERARIATVFLGRAVHRTLFGIARRALRVLVGGR